MSKKRQTKASDTLDLELSTYTEMANSGPLRDGLGVKGWLSFGAASAALVVGSAAEASVMYSGPQNITVGGTNAFGSASVDLDGDSVNDFRFNASNSAFSTPGFTTTYGGTTGGFSGSSGFATAGALGSNLVGRNNYSVSTNIGPLNSASFAKGLSVGENLLGVQFDISGNNHFGWIRVDVNAGPFQGAPAGLTVVDWAYESRPEGAIHVGSVPEPEMAWLFGLGLLAAGATGVRRMRKRRLADA